MKMPKVTLCIAWTGSTQIGEGITLSSQNRMP